MSVQGIVDVEVTLNADKDVEVSEDKKNHLAIITPKRFLGGEAFKDLNTKIWKMGGKYVSAGKNSHWEVPLKPKEEPTVEKPIKKCSRCGTQTSAPTIHEGAILCGKCAGDIKASLEQPIPETETAKPVSLRTYQLIAPNMILSMPFQCRQNKDDPELQELAESILQSGVIEPIVVRPKQSGFFELVAGTRRFQACKIANLTLIPCIVKPLNDREAFEHQISENIQRKDLTDIEKAKMLNEMLTRFKEAYPTQALLAKRLGKSESWISRHLALITQQEPFLPRGKNVEITEGLTRELRSVPEEKRQEIIKKIEEHIEETGKPLPISQIHELAHPEEPTQLKEPSDLGTHSEPSYKEPPTEIQAEPSKPSEPTPKPKETDTGMIFACPCCNYKATIIHVDSETPRHKLEEVHIA